MEAIKPPKGWDWSTKDGWKIDLNRAVDYDGKIKNIKKLPDVWLHGLVIILIVIFQVGSTLLRRHSDQQNSKQLKRNTISVVEEGLLEKDKVLMLRNVAVV